MKKVIVLVAMISLQACGLALLDPNARNNVSPASPAGPEIPGEGDNSYTVGGTVVGLPLGFDLDGDINTLPYTFEDDGTFTFPYDFDDQVDYVVSVGMLPGGYNCSVENGTGTIDGANVTDVLITCVCQPDDSIGVGTPSSPIEIYDAIQLNTVATSNDPDVRTYHYKQMCDIDYTGIDPTPIGRGNSKFTGSYDGQGFFIFNYTSDFNDPSVQGKRKGLFGHTQNAVLTNINLQDFVITADASMNDGNFNTGSMGALVGFANNTNISHIYAKNISIPADDQTVECVGGLVGVLDAVNYNNAVKQSGLNHIHIDNVDIIGNASMFVGGVIGGSVSNHGLNKFIVGENINIHDCYSHCGGLIGNYYSYGPDFNGNLLGFKFVQIENSSINGNGRVGGLGGSFNGHIDQSSFEGTVTVTDLATPAPERLVGGAFGHVYDWNNVSNNFVIADVFSGALVSGAGVFYGKNNNDNAIFASNSYLSGQTCQNCTGNSEIDAQANVDAFYNATDSSITDAPFAWDFVSTWCTRSGNVPTLFDVPFSNCD